MSRSPSLLELQRWLRWVITDPRGPVNVLAPEAANPRPEITAAAEPRAEPLPRQLSAIIDAPPLPREERLGIYADAYFIRLAEALAADFSAVRRALGRGDFHRLAADYLRRHPSNSPHVGDLGEALPGFIAAHPAAVARPFLPDLARLEWAALCSLYSARQPAMDFSVLASLAPSDWAAVRLSLDPTVRLLRVDWAVDRLWRDRHKPDGEGRCALSRRARRRLVVARDAHWVRVLPVSDPEWLVLDRIGDGISLGTLCADLSAAFPHPPPLTDWFHRWAQSGILCGAVPVAS